MSLSDVKDRVQKNPARRLKYLYLVRMVFAVAWVITLTLLPIAAQKGEYPDLIAAALLVIYPVSDVIATIFDIRATPSIARVAQRINLVAGILTAVGIAVASLSSWGAVSFIFGFWAIASGAVMLIVAIRRRRIVGGQWMMILSAVGSIAGGLGFLQYLGGQLTITTLETYSEGGAFFYLISALLLTRLGTNLSRAVQQAFGRASAVDEAED